jgi:hypothetical protein
VGHVELFLDVVHDCMIALAFLLAIILSCVCVCSR